MVKMMNQDQKNEHIKELIIKRSFNISRTILYEMWTKPEHLSKWYGPKNFSVSECRTDLQPGGEFFINMKSPDGKIYPSTGIWRELDPPGKLVFSLVSHFDDNGHPQMEMLNTLIFEEEENITKMIMKIKEIKTLPEINPLKGLDFAWNQSFDKLSSLIESLKK